MDVQMKFGAVTLYLYKMELVLRTFDDKQEIIEWNACLVGGFNY